MTHWNLNVETIYQFSNPWKNILKDTSDTYGIKTDFFVEMYADFDVLFPLEHSWMELQDLIHHDKYFQLTVCEENLVRIKSLKHSASNGPLPDGPCNQHEVIAWTKMHFL